MVLRNRLIALLLRVAIFVLYMASLGAYMAQFSSFWVALSTFSVEMGLVGSIMLGLEIIFNLIDLRHGIHGVPAGPYMPMGLPINVFCVLAGVLYFAALLPNNAAPAGTFALLLHITLIIGPLIDWIFLDEKGTVRFVNGFVAQLYPILFFIFGYFRTVIWPDAPIYNGNMYALPFLDYTNPNIVGYAFAFFGMTLASVTLAIVLNNVFAGRYGAIHRADD